MAGFNRIFKYFLIFIIPLLFFSNCEDDVSEYESLKTPEGTIFFFNIFGDSRSGNDIYAQLLSLSRAPKWPAFTIHLGDMISRPTASDEWFSFMLMMDQYHPNGKLYPVIGNHDVNDHESMKRFLQVFPIVPETGYYTALEKDLFFIFLNSEDVNYEGEPDEQFLWLERQLTSSEAQAAEAIIVSTHKPLFPQHKHKNDPIKNNEKTHALFVKHKVPLVLQAHEHSYSHIEKDGIHYVVSGGAGSPLHTRYAREAAFFHFVRIYSKQDELEVRVIDLLGRKRDEFFIKK